jgi:hypothetical protein
MNNMNYIGSSLMIFDLDSHLYPNKFKDKKRNDDIKRKRVNIEGRPISILNNNLQLPPIK